MIVRISTENQYVFPDDQADRLNDLDNAVVAAVEADDEDALPRGASRSCSRSCAPRARRSTPRSSRSPT